MVKAIVVFAVLISPLANPMYFPDDDQNNDSSTCFVFNPESCASVYPFEECGGGCIEFEHPSDLTLLPDPFEEPVTTLVCQGPVHAQNPMPNIFMSAIPWTMTSTQSGQLGRSNVGSIHCGNKWLCGCNPADPGAGCTVEAFLGKKFEPSYIPSGLGTDCGFGL